MRFDELYERYLEERQATSVVKGAKSFATYRFVDQYIYLEDIFVLPECRDADEGKQLLEAVAAIGRAKGYSKLMGSVVPSLPGAARMLRVMLHVGFELHASEKDIVYLVKEI